MSKIVPPHPPQQSREETLRILQTGGVSSAVALLGVRGYYRRSMGDVRKNDRGIYDDAIFLVSPRTHASFNANVDPSIFRKGIAKLARGVWLYRVGIHGLSKPKDQRYVALVQAGLVEIERDNDGNDRGFFGINIHRGSFGSASSLGCQTIYPDQWAAFISLVRKELDFYGQQTIPYMLVEEPNS